jgi:hypothetical protein
MKSPRMDYFYIYNLTFLACSQNAYDYLAGCKKVNLFFVKVNNLISLVKTSSKQGRLLSKQACFQGNEQATSDYNVNSQETRVF